MCVIFGKGSALDQLFYTILVSLERQLEEKDDNSKILNILQADVISSPICSEVVWMS